MEKQTRALIYVGTTKVSTKITDLDLKIRVAEHIRAQYDCYGTTDVRDILNETKPGAWKRPTLLKMLKMVFPVS